MSQKYSHRGHAGHVTRISLAQELIFEKGKSDLHLAQNPCTSDYVAEFFNVSVFLNFCSIKFECHSTKLRKTYDS